jgi:DNA polymerase
MSPHAPSLAHEFEAALAWWHMAGVDCDFVDDATTWLTDQPQASPASALAKGAAERRNATATPREAGDTALRGTAPLADVPAPPSTPRRDFLGDSPPADLPAFRQWWMETPDLSPTRGFPRVPPRGEAGAALMVLVPQPEADDRETLLSGPQGRLLANILAATGLEESAVYMTAALPSHMPLADLPALAAGGMDAVTLHHIALVNPSRVLAFGNGLGPMIGAPTDQPLREINHGGRKTPAIVSETLDALMEMPRLKARFWRRWMEWSATV